MTGIKNLDKTAKRILKAVERNEKIIIYGDSDMDGTASVIILQEAVKNLGGKNTQIYFPDRENEGYGISEKALENLKKFLPCILISLDLGIGNWKEVKIARKMGFEIIIIDHHEILEKLPKANIVVDPKQKGDKYPFKQLATAGLVFKLAELLFENSPRAFLRGKMPEAMRKNFLELSAMATIADMMPKQEDNAIIISEGLNFLKTSWRPGIKILFGLEEFRDLDLTQKVYKVNSLLNIRDVENNLPASFRILTAQNEEEAEILAEKLRKKGAERKEMIQKILNEIEARIVNSGELIIFEGNEKSAWDIALLGVIASLLAHKFKKPAFLFAKGEKESMASIRAPSGFNVVEAMKGFSKKLITYGGHPQAAGFRIKNENLEDFKNYLIKYFSK